MLVVLLNNKIKKYQIIVAFDTSIIEQNNVPRVGMVVGIGVGAFVLIGFDVGLADGSDVGLEVVGAAITGVGKDNVKLYAASSIS